MEEVSFFEIQNKNFNKRKPVGWWLEEEEIFDEEIKAFSKYCELEKAFVCAINDELKSGDADLHIVFSDSKIESHRSNFIFKKTTQGGVVCFLPEEETELLNKGKIYIKQMHSFAKNLSPQVIKTLKKAAKNKRALKITGVIFKGELHQEQKNNAEAVEAMNFQNNNILNFDESNNCLMLHIFEVEFKQDEKSITSFVTRCFGWLKH